MKHICNKNNLIIIEQKETLTIYQCVTCGKKSYELGSIVISNNALLPRYKLYVEWSNKNPLIRQIHNLKKLVPALKNINNKELLDIARNNNMLCIGEMYLSEANELINIAKTYNIDLNYEEL